MRESFDPLDVLVVGAGPTGLALAAQLERYGARFRLVDRQPDQVHESRALAVQPRTLEVLAGLGSVSDDMVACGNAAVRLELHSGERSVPVDLFDISVEDTGYPYLLFLSQAETERILADHLGDRNVEVERGTELVGLDLNGGTAECTLRHDSGDQAVVRAQYVVGCDGAHSAVRQFAGIPFEGGSYPQTFVLADVEADGLQPGRVHTFLSAQGILFLFPLGAPATWRVIAMRPRTDLTPVERPVELADVQNLVDSYTPVRVRVHDPVWMTNFRLHSRGARHYRRGPVFLAGDAAHIHSPAGAQGMNTGIQDAVNLGWKLGMVSADQVRPDVLDSYEPERAPVGRRVLRFTDRAFTVGASTNPVVGFARTRIAPRVLPLALRVQAGRARTRCAPSRNSASATVAAPSRKTARQRRAAGPGRVTGCRTRPSPPTAGRARCTVRWLRPDSMCCCADPPTHGRRQRTGRVLSPCTGWDRTTSPAPCMTTTVSRLAASGCPLARPLSSSSARTAISPTGQAGQTSPGSATTSPSGC